LIGVAGLVTGPSEIAFSTEHEPLGADGFGGAISFPGTIDRFIIVLFEQSHMREVKQGPSLQVRLMLSPGDGKAFREKRTCPFIVATLDFQGTTSIEKLTAHGSLGIETRLVGPRDALLRFFVVMQPNVRDAGPDLPVELQVIVLMSEG